MRVPAPALRIVSDDAVDAAHARLDGARDAYCDGTAAAAGRRARGRRVAVPALRVRALCGLRRRLSRAQRGSTASSGAVLRLHVVTGSAAPAVCSNGLVAPMERVDAEVLATLAGRHPATGRRSMRRSRWRSRSSRRRAGGSRRRRTLEAELDDGRRRSAGGSRTRSARAARSTSLVRPPAGASGATRRDCRRNCADCVQRRAARSTRTALERRLRAKLADWRGLLTRNVASGRDVLRKLLLAGPIRFTPVNEDGRRGYRFEGRSRSIGCSPGVLELAN